MTSHPRIALAFRRTIVTAGVVGSLVLGAVTVRAAAAWTASAAPLDAPPVSVTDLAQRLSDEQARSEALEVQLVDLTSRTTELATALDAATQRIGTDTNVAKSLRAQLTTAQKKLAALMKALKAPARTTTTTAPRPTATPAPTREPGGDD
jgi:hypothetical protein